MANGIGSRRRRGFYAPGPPALLPNMNQERMFEEQERMLGYGDQPSVPPAQIAPSLGLGPPRARPTIEPWEPTLGPAVIRRLQATPQPTVPQFTEQQMLDALGMLGALRAPRTRKRRGRR